MIVNELMDELAKYDGDLEVVLSSDGEGNGFDGLFQVSDGMYDTRYKEIFEPDDKEMLTEDCIKAIVLWP